MIIKSKSICIYVQNKYEISRKLLQFDEIWGIIVLGGNFFKYIIQIVIVWKYYVIWENPNIL